MSQIAVSGYDHGLNPIYQHGDQTLAIVLNLVPRARELLVLTADDFLDNSARKLEPSAKESLFFNIVYNYLYSLGNYAEFSLKNFKYGFGGCYVSHA